MAVMRAMRAFLLLAWVLSVPAFAAATLPPDVDPDDLETRIRSVIDDMCAATVRIDTEDGMGSGTIIDAEGRILTSAHVIEGCRSVEVTLIDGRRFVAEVLGINGAGDLALLDIDAEDITHATLGDSDDVKPRQWIVAIGHPVSAFDDFMPTFSAGIVRKLDAIIRASRVKVFRNAIVSDAPLSSGSSGGGLFDLQGRLIGVNAAVTHNENEAFSVRINEFKQDRARLLRGDRFDRRAEWRRSRSGPAATSASRLSYFRKHFSTVERRLRSRTVSLREGRRRARGLLVSTGGDLLAPSRSFPGAAAGDVVEATLDERALDATVVAVDLTNDVLLLRLPAEEGPYDHYTLGRFQPERGALVMALSAAGLSGGIVSGAHRAPPLMMTRNVWLPDVHQIDLRLYSRDVGTGVVDREGRLLGMVVQHRLRDNDGPRARDPYGAFALPVRALAESYALLRDGSGRGERPVGFLGAMLEDLSEDDKARFGVSGGVLIATVSGDHPADRAGIRRGDVITRIGESDIGSRGEAMARITSARRGERLAMQVRRGGRDLRIVVEMGDRSDL